MRTAPCAFVVDPVGATELLASTTHADALAIATCVAQSLLIKSLASGEIGTIESHLPITTGIQNVKKITP